MMARSVGMAMPYVGKWRFPKMGEYPKTIDDLGVPPFQENSIEGWNMNGPDFRNLVISDQYPWFFRYSSDLEPATKPIPVVDGSI